ncbi:MAG TPA: LysR family transcriptional regulator [Myxococcota bacterium]|nr:LysR family transcriptional regulator [Myxococcota bacterium]
MTLDELESFVCIAGGLGFTQASRRLHRSQPAISRRIHQLEEALGAPLFERIGRGSRLTDAGRALLPYAEAVLAAVRDGRRAVREAAEHTEAPLRLDLAIVGTLADRPLVEALRALRRHFPGAAIALRTANSREVSALVRRGEADLGLRYHRDPDPRLECVELGVERLFLVVPPDHPVRARRVASLDRFASDAWLGFPERPDNPDQSLELTLIAAGIERPQVIPIDSLTAQKRLVEAGVGVALLPRSAFREELSRGSVRAVEVANFEAAQPVFAVRRRRGHRGPLASVLLERLRKASTLSRASG